MPRYEVLGSQSGPLYDGEDSQRAKTEYATAVLQSLNRSGEQYVCFVVDGAVTGEHTLRKH